MLRGLVFLKWPLFKSQILILNLGFFVSWEKEIEVFSQHGEPAEHYEEIESRLVSFSDDLYTFETHLEFNEKELLEFAEIYEPTDEERKVLEIVKKDPVMGIQKIARCWKVKRRG